MKWKFCTMYIVQLAYKKHTVLLLQSSPIDQYTLSLKVSAIAILISCKNSGAEESHMTT